MSKEFFLKSKYGLEYSFVYYNYSEWQALIEELKAEGQVSLEEHRVFFSPSDPSEIYIFNDGRVLLTDNSSASIFEYYSYSIWLFENGKIEKAIDKVGKNESIETGGVMTVYKSLPSFVIEVMVDSAKVNSDLSDDKNHVYLLLDGRVVLIRETDNYRSLLFGSLEDLRLFLDIKE